MIRALQQVKVMHGDGRVTNTERSTSGYPYVASTHGQTALAGACMFAVLIRKGTQRRQLLLVANLTTKSCNDMLIDPLYYSAVQIPTEFYYITTYE